MESSIGNHCPEPQSILVQPNNLAQLLTDLGLQQLYPNKLSLNNAMELVKEPLVENRPITAGEIHRYFLRMVMKNDTNARALPTGTILDCAQKDRKATDGLDSTSRNVVSKEIAFHPLDIITAVFLCADPSLQRELLIKMSMSHFALPLLLTHLGESPVFLMGPLCSIVKKYYPQSMKAGSVEQSITTANLPTIAFLRLGRCSMSKSKLLNDIFSHSQQHHNFFIHSNMECADIPRRVSDGMIEVFWYLSGMKEVGSFPKALAVMNLRGDATEFVNHVSYLTRISATVFVCVDNVDYKIKRILTSLIKSPEKLVMLINPKPIDVEITELSLKKLIRINYLSKNQIVSKSQKSNEMFIRELRSKLQDLLGNNDYPKKSLKEMAEVAREIGFEVNEDKGEVCESGRSLNVSCKDHLYNQLLTDLGLQKYFPKNLTVKKMLEIRAKPLPDRLPKTPEDIPWYFFRKLMTANSMARSIKCDGDEIGDSLEKEMGTKSFYPLDVITTIFLCADPFLKQELVMKMSSCQFAVPLLLPGTKGKILFLLRSLCSLVKKWCPYELQEQKRFIEIQVISANLPTIAFLRLGCCSMSKSKLLNDILSPSQQHHNFFIHSNMECADVPRKVSDGLVEICWYLPEAIEQLYIIPKAFSVMNLRGDAIQFTKQVSFLARVSTAVFVCVDNITEEEARALSALSLDPQILYLIVNPEKNQLDITNRHLRKLSQESKIKMNNVLSRQEINDATLVENVQKQIAARLHDINGQSKKPKSLAEMVSCARQSGLDVDEDDREYKEGKRISETILPLLPIKDIAQFKKNKLYFQGDKWKQISKIEKQICRLGDLRQDSVAMDTDKLKKNRREIQKKLIQKGMSEIVGKFIENLIRTSGDGRKHFLYLMKYELDYRSREILSDLRIKYKQPWESSKNQKGLQEFDKKIVESSLGLQHFLREIGLVYETFLALNEIPPNISKLPSIAAELLIDGFPLELIDGDVSSVAVDWVTEVLKQVEKKKGEECRVFVLTVLGIQSTGKSTLLNTMFGLQFAVSSGQCTRGAFMQLIPIVGDLKSEIGCDFILVIDTEGLKQQMSDIGGTHEHDNELATFVIGLSDLTLINMSVKSPSEMEDVLQMVVHAFIRMSEVGRKPFCQFVHQNAGDVSVHEQNMSNWKDLNDRLDKMTLIAAKIEKVEGSISKFSDVINYRPDKDNWYIPGLGHIVYSQKVVELKQRVLEHFTQRKASTVTQFIRYFTNLWSAVKHENFIFSFQNSFVVDAYNELSAKYSDLEWELRNTVYDFVELAQKRIEDGRNHLDNILDDLRNELLKVVETKKAEVSKTLEDWFSAQNQKVHQIQDYKTPFLKNIGILCCKLEEDSQKQWKKTVQRQEGSKKLQDIKNNFVQRIVENVNALIHSLKQKTKSQNDSELNVAFETMWSEAISLLEIYQPKVANIRLDMEISLRENIMTHGSSLNKELEEKGVDEWGKSEFKVNEKHIVLRSTRDRALSYVYTINCEDAQKQAEILITKSKDEMENIIQQDMDYDPKYCKTLLRNLDKILDCEFPTFRFTEKFRTYFKLHICGIGIQRFQEVNDSFRKKNDPSKIFETEKNFYKQIIVNMYKEKDQSQSCAKLYLDSCIKPALMEDLNQKLGRTIADYIKSTRKAEEFKSRRNLQVGIMLDLTKKNCFDDYYQYINDSHEFQKRWVEEQVLKYCENSEQEITLLHKLALGILEPAVDSIQKAIRDIETLDGLTAWNFLTEFRKTMEGKIVLPQDKFNNEGFVKNTPHFVDALKGLVNGLKGDLSKTIKQWNVRSKVSELPVAPWKLLYDTLSGCGEQCPYCGVLCDSTIREHDKHSANYHLPEGLRGYRWTFWKTLVTNSCSDTSYIILRLYREEDPWWKSQLSIQDSWIIPKSRDAGVPPYWKWVFYTHNQSIAKTYGVRPATGINDWNIPWSEIKTDIEEKYNVRIDEFPASLQPV